MIEPSRTPSESPRTLPTLLEEALELFRQQNVEGAVGRCTVILDQDPRNFGALHLLGMSQLHLGHVESAVKSLQRALTLNPRSAATHFHIGLAWWNQACRDEALKHFQFALVFQPDHLEARFHCACALQALLREEEALIHWDRLLTLTPGNAAAHLNRGLVLQELGRGDEAKASFTQALQLDSDLETTLLARAWELKVAHRHVESLAALEPVISRSPNMGEALEVQARVLEAMSIAASAEALLRELDYALPTEPSPAARCTAILARLPEVEFAFGKDARFAQDCLKLIPHLHREGRSTEAEALAAQCATAIRAGKLPPGLPFRFLQTVSDNVCELSMGIESYRCQAEAGGFDPLKAEVYFHGFSKTPTHANTQLDRMWERTLPFLPLDQAGVDDLVRRSAGFHEQVRLGLSRDKWGSASFGDPHVCFTPDEIAQGESLLKELGIPVGTPIMCFHARDQGYDKALGRYRTTFTRYRDSHIQDMLPAAAAMARLGYTAVRMGSRVERRLTNLPSGVVDYASSELRSDFLDVYLMSRCKFFLGGDAGVYALAEMFRRPVAFVNFSVWPEVHTWFQLPFIPKKYWSTRLGRLLTFREIFATRASSLYTLGDQAFQDAGIQLLDNSPEEIRDLALEVDARLNGTWTVLDEDVQLQAGFWKRFKQLVVPCLHGHYRTRIGAAFLRENQAWLLG